MQVKAKPKFGALRMLAILIVNRTGTGVQWTTTQNVTYSARLSSTNFGLVLMQHFDERKKDKKNLYRLCVRFIKMYYVFNFIVSLDKYFYFSVSFENVRTSYFITFLIFLLFIPTLTIINNNSIRKVCY